ncbi:glycosyl transferase family 2 domain-containing protein [Ditylenchus destructor]|nr:glycosyl transferase family 2 domain-containing protein [Ditylenchus destructor]
MDDPVTWLCILPVCLPGFAILLFVGLSYLTPWPKRNWSYFTAKRFHFKPSNASTDESDMFSNLLMPSNLYLSVVVPAMNEEDRLPLMLDECLEYLEKRHKENTHFTYEVIVVDDGSKDRTCEVAYEYSKTHPIYVYELPENVGKGGAVRNGVLCSRGQLVLFADADGATTFSEFGKLERELRTLCNGSQSQLSEPIDWTHPGMVVGSRAHLEKDSISSRSIFRTILMVGFHVAVYIFAVRTVRDTQCGFKLFSRSAAAKLFPRIHIEKWAFDVELLYLAEALNFSISEVAVQWTEIDGSKVTPLIAAVQMGRDIVLIWFRYLFKIWRVNQIEV